jgi:hypothetical protein
MWMRMRVLSCSGDSSTDVLILIPPSSCAGRVLGLRVWGRGSGVNACVTARDGRSP